MVDDTNHDALVQGMTKRQRIMLTVQRGVEVATQMRRTPSYLLGTLDGEAAGEAKGRARLRVEARARSRIEGWSDGWDDGWTDGWIDGWDDGWHEGWVEGWCKGEVRERVSAITLMLANRDIQLTPEEVAWLKQWPLDELPSITFVNSMQSAEEFWRSVKPDIKDL